MSASKTTGKAAARGGQASLEPAALDIEAATRNRSLAERCEKAFRCMAGADCEGVPAEDRGARAIRCMLEGTGFSRAGIAWYSDDRSTISLSVQERSGMLLETTVLDVADVASAQAILAGTPVSIADCDETSRTEDALMRELGAGSFFAEPFGELGEVCGFVFVADRMSIGGGMLALRTFLINIGTWLVRGGAGQDGEGLLRDEGSTDLMLDTLQYIGLGVVVFDEDMRLAAVNEPVREMLDAGPEVLRIGASLDEMVVHFGQRGDYGSESADEQVARMRELIASRKPHSFERRLLDGRTISCKAQPRNGGYVVTYTDVTEFYARERERLEREALLSDTLNHMEHGLIVFDADLTVLAVNEQTRSMLGVPEASLHVGTSMKAFISHCSERGDHGEGDVRKIADSIQAMVASGEAFDFLSNLPDGRIISCAGRPRTNGGFVLTLSDVTDSEHRKQELAVRTSTMEATFQHMDQGLLAFDGNLTVLFANERAKAMLELPSEMLEPGRDFGEVVRLALERGDLYGPNVPTVEQMLARVRGTEPFSFERHCTDDRIALVRCHPRPQGGFVVTYTDITASRRQQEEMAGMADALRQKGVQLDTVFTNMSSGVVMFDDDCRLVICNPRYREMFQLSDELSQPGTRLEDMYADCIERGYEADVEALTADRIALVKSRESSDVTMNLTNGRIVHAKYEPLEDGGSIAVFEDITVRIAAEKRLKAYAADLEHQRSVLQTVMETIDQGITLVDGDLKMQAFNSRFFELLEFPPDLVRSGDSMEKLFRYNVERSEYGAGDPDQQVRERMELAAKFEPHCFVRERPDGTALQIEGKPLVGHGGFVTTYTDVTEARRHEMEIKALADRLTETNLQLNAALNSMSQGLAMFDAEHRLVVRNEHYLELFGFPEDLAVPGTSLEALTRYSVEVGNEGDPEGALDRRMQIAALRETAVYRRNMANGRVIEITHEPMSNGGSLALYLDVTDREAAERNLRDHAAKLEASNRELQEFAYVAAHDLQEPLRKIEAFGDRLYKVCGDRLGEDGERYVSRMQASSRRLRSLIDALLEYSRVTTKAAPFKPVGLERIVRDAVSDLDASVEEAGARIEVGSLPTIDGDALQLRQLFLNLIGNALKFRHEERPPLVRIDAVVERRSDDDSDDEGREVCVLSVADNGIGFENKYGERIFTIFQRLHSRAEYEGTGIGLATCRKIAERHDGTIRSYGKQGEGATFEIMLPLNRSF